MAVMSSERSPALALRSVASVHAGRIVSYATLGAAAGGLGTAAVGNLDPSLGHHLLRWAASASLAWIGLSTAGLLPGPIWLAELRMSTPSGRRNK